LSELAATNLSPAAWPPFVAPESTADHWLSAFRPVKNNNVSSSPIGFMMFLITFQVLASALSPTD
jgi:hypothetical protein